ncbi:hypothetical protein ABWK22_19755 [Gottfriedia acidiceleris]|uniref:hypothetical protein n=1 Tax=Gottfriedia acidiceleris TaxID=371036 RepID=UPI0033917235
MFEGGDFMFTFGPIFIGITFVIVISIVLFSIIKGFTQWNKNGMIVEGDVRELTFQGTRYQGFIRSR